MQKIFLYNTKTKKKEEFKSIQEGVVKMYSCGPTVYNYAHIGNLRSYIFPDILKKTLRMIGYKVEDLINFTDVGHLVSDGDEGEDKMEKRAKEEGKDAWEISKFYSEAFKSDLKKLNIGFPKKFPKATNYISEQIDLIKKLEKNGFTYKTSDGVYFDTKKFPKYGDFANIKVDDLKKGARVDFGEKKNPTDFALWKFSNGKKRQMEWESPWGIGFPGWHSECTAMIFKELGETIDIHTGGTDHIRIHHTNEIAQAECATGKNYVNYWMHGEFLVLDKVGDGAEKMSKSSGNFITIKTLEEKGFDPIIYKFFALQNNYRKFLTFSFENLKVAEKGYLNLKKEIRNVFEKISDDEKNIFKEEKNFSDLEKKFEKIFEFGKIFDKKILEKFCDDLATPQVLVLIRDLLKEKNISPEEKIFLIKKYNEILGLNLLDFSNLEEEKSEKIPEEIKILIEERKNFKKEKKFKKADEIKEKIFGIGFEIKDTRDGIEIKKL